MNAEQLGKIKLKISLIEECIDQIVEEIKRNNEPYELCEQADSMAAYASDILDTAEGLVNDAEEERERLDDPQEDR